MSFETAGFMPKDHGNTKNCKCASASACGRNLPFPNVNYAISRLLSDTPDDLAWYVQIQYVAQTGTKDYQRCCRSCGDPCCCSTVSFLCLTGNR